MSRDIAKSEEQTWDRRSDDERRAEDASERHRHLKPVVPHHYQGGDGDGDGPRGEPILHYSTKQQREQQEQQERALELAEQQ